MVIDITNIIIFSIKVASVMGNFSTVPRQAQLILLLSSKLEITPTVVIDKIIIVIIKAVFNDHLIKNIIPKIDSRKGYILLYKTLLLATGSYCAKASGKDL